MSENLYVDFLCAALFICFTYSTIIEWEYVRVISWLSLMNDGVMKLYTLQEADHRLGCFVSLVAVSHILKMIMKPACHNDMFKNLTNFSVSFLLASLS